MSDNVTGTNDWWDQAPPEPLVEQNEHQTHVDSWWQNKKEDLAAEDTNDYVENDHYRVDEHQDQDGQQQQHHHHENYQEDEHQGREKHGHAAAQTQDQNSNRYYYNYKKDDEVGMTTAHYGACFDWGRATWNYEEQNESDEVEKEQDHVATITNFTTSTPTWENEKNKNWSSNGRSWEQSAWDGSAAHQGEKKQEVESNKKDKYWWKACYKNKENSINGYWDENKDSKEEDTKNCSWGVENYRVNNYKKSWDEKKDEGDYKWDEKKENNFKWDNDKRDDSKNYTSWDDHKKDRNQEDKKQDNYNSWNKEQDDRRYSSWEQRDRYDTKTADDDNSKNKKWTDASSSWGNKNSWDSWNTASLWKSDWDHKVKEQEQEKSYNEECSTSYNDVDHDNKNSRTSYNHWWSSWTNSYCNNKQYDNNYSATSTEDATSSIKKSESSYNWWNSIFSETSEPDSTADDETASEASWTACDLEQVEAFDISEEVVVVVS
ncbi:unnamed protein product [Amoebophrya sp. A25]|nr:unnamed protein product [Amoebophrya sp. A25]|eukprot:GSA25T00010234001.1